MYNMAELIRVCLILHYGGEAVTGWVHYYKNSNTTLLSQDIAYRANLFQIGGIVWHRDATDGHVI